MDTLRIIGMVLGWAAVFTTIVGVYWKLRMKAQELELKLKELEKEYIKELNDVDSKMERVFKAVSERREEVKKEYLTLDKHTDLCKVVSMELENVVRESGDAIKAKVEETIVDFQREVKLQIDAVLAAVQANGKAKI